MTNVTRIVAGLWAATLMTTSALAASPEEMVNAASGLDQAFLKAMNEHNAEALAALYWNSPDVMFFPPDAMVVKGMAAVKQSFMDMTATMPACHLEMTESHNVPMGDVVLGWGIWHMTMPGPDGKPMEMDGRYTDVKAMKDGKWVYLMDHASVPASPPPMPEAMPEGMPKK